MIRAEAIAFITTKLPSIDDEGVMAIADIVQSIEVPDSHVRELTPHELALLEQSKDDFKNGRTYTLDQARAMTDEFLVNLGVVPSRR
jgi:hypothetical protein